MTKKHQKSVQKLTLAEGCHQPQRGGQHARGGASAEPLRAGISHRLLCPRGRPLLSVGGMDLSPGPLLFIHHPYHHW